MEVATEHFRKETVILEMVVDCSQAMHVGSFNISRETRVIVCIYKLNTADADFSNSIPIAILEKHCRIDTIFPKLRRIYGEGSPREKTRHFTLQN